MSPAFQAIATIADGSYPLARSLYIYVKKAHIGVTPGLQQFIAEFMSDSATGRGGYSSGTTTSHGPMMSTSRTASRRK